MLHFIKSLFSKNQPPREDNLIESELKVISEGLLNNWKIDYQDYWFPLVELPEHYEVLTFHVYESEIKKHEKLIIDILKKNNDFIYYVGENGNNKYSSSEIYWILFSETFVTNSTSQWVIYTSHENTVTFSGSLFDKELLPFLKSCDITLNPWS